MSNRKPSSAGAFIGPLRSIPFLLLRPKLLGLALAGPAINLTIFLIVYTTLTLTVTRPAVERVQQAIPWLGDGLSIVASVVISFIFLVIGAIMVLLLAGPLAAPFLDSLSRRIEDDLLRDRPELRCDDPPLLQSILHSVREALRRLSILLVLVSITFVISLTPILGPPLAAILVYTQAALFLSLDAFSYSLDRRGWTFGEKLRLLAARPKLWLPLGAMQALLVLIPCSIFFLPTLGAVAGTRQLCRHGRITPEIMTPKARSKSVPSIDA